MFDKRTNPMLENVLVPGAAAIVTGLLVGMVTLSYCMLATQPAAIAFMAGSVGALLAWILRPQPGATALPNLPTTGAFQQVTKLHIVSEGGHVGDFLNLDIDRARLETFARGLAAGRGMTSREWTGKHALFSGSEFSRLRGELIERGYARWNSERDSRGGCSLTGKGKAAFRCLAALPHSPGGRDFPVLQQ